MNKNSLFNSAKELLSEIKDSFEAQKNISNKIPQIEIDLLLEKVRNFYDVLIKIDEQNKQSEKPGQPEQTEKEKQIDKQPKLEVIEIEEKIQKPETEVDDIESEKILIQESLPEEKPDKSGSIDLFSGPSENNSEETKTIVEKISEGKQQESIADKIQKDRIKDIKSAIGINEKFFFINELFDGIMKDYNDAIDQLDKFTSPSDANNYLKLLSEKHNWNKDSDAFVQLVEFVERKK